MPARSLNVVPPVSTAAPWYAGGLAFECTQCGNCCTGPTGYVWISPVEVQRLAGHLGMSIEQTVESYCRPIGNRLSLRERRTAQGNYDCIFLEERKVAVANGDGPRRTETRRVCGVYSVRPLQCRTWPFWEGNLASPEAWCAAGQRCPGINRGQRVGRDRIEALRGGNCPL